MRDTNNTIIPEWLFSTQSGLSIPGTTTIAVRNANGTAIQNIPVYLLNHNLTRQFNPGEVRTNSAGNAHFRIPNRIRRDDRSAPSVWMQNDTYLEHVRGHFAVIHKGFIHTGPMEQDFSTGGFGTFAMPHDSVVTVQQLGAGVSRTVHVTDVNLTRVISWGPITSGSPSGQAAFAVPTGTQFRFLVVDEDGTQIASGPLTAPASATVRLVVHNQPTLIAPINGASFDVDDILDFSWNPVNNATQYAWLYRHSSGTNFQGFVVNDTSLDGVQFNLSGEWEWAVQAFDSSGNLIAQSAIRAFTLDNEEEQSSGAMMRFASSDIQPSANLMSRNLAKLTEVSVETVVISEVLTAHIANIEMDAGWDESDGWNRSNRWNELEFDVFEFDEWNEFENLLHFDWLDWLLQFEE
jgi:hypothetical protein